jgi:hypothetical protein
VGGVLAAMRSGLAVGGGGGAVVCGRRGVSVGGRRGGAVVGRRRRGLAEQEDSE